MRPHNPGTYVRKWEKRYRKQFLKHLTGILKTMRGITPPPNPRRARG